MPDAPPPTPHHHPHHVAQPDFVAELRADLADWRQWVARTVVLVYAALAGLSVVVFTWLCERALDTFHTLANAHAWLPFVWTPLLCASIAAVTRRHFPGASGSGIPQVMAALDRRMTELELPRFVSLRLAVAKVGLTAAGLLGGLAIGREGPSVQIAAGVMLHARRWLPDRASITAHGLLVAGGAAGIAAAFNAPLAGVMFAIEELTRKIEQRSSGLVIAAIVFAGLIGVSAYGNRAYFGVIHVPPLDLGFVLPAVMVVLAAAGLGGVFSRLLYTSIVGGPDRVSRWRREHPVRFAAVCGLLIAAAGWASGGATFGSGYGYTRRLLEGHSDIPLLYVTLRFVATWLAVWSGVPGGLFAPSLAIGAGLGDDVALLTHSAAFGPPLIAPGMVAFLAAVTQAPITAFIIVMEMVDDHAMVLSLMAAALCASLIARWVSRPLYAALAAAQLARLQAAAPDTRPTSLPSSPPAATTH